MPPYVRDGEVEVVFASRPRHLSLRILRTDVMAISRDALSGLNLGKGCLRYGQPDEVNPAVVRVLLTRTAAPNGPIC